MSARDVIREALTNSIHAGGTLITVDLHFSDRQKEISGVANEERKVLEQITITDNGEGFTETNLKCFDEICTDHKNDIGGKGVGRLAFLKYAERVEIQSQLENEFVEFIYTPAFKPDDVKTLPKLGERSTRIQLSNLKEKINTQVPKLVNSICDDLRLLLFLKHQAGQSITIRFTHNSRQKFEELFDFHGEQIQSQISKEFGFQGYIFKCYGFRDEPPKKGIVAMLCADELCIEEYVISKRFDVCRHLIFVTSTYFNERSNMERQRLEIPKTEDDVDLATHISRESLMPKLHEECLAMIEEFDGKDIQNFKSENIKKLQKYYPFIAINSLGGNAAMLDAEAVVKTYRAEQERIEDKLVEQLEAGKPVSWDDISHLASEDLARFIVHRALVIESLVNLPPSSAEDAIHSAILPKKSDGSVLRENNVWLVDDKFLSYSSVFSDVGLTKILKNVGDRTYEKQNRRPDVAAFFSKDSESKPNKLVIIEFKKTSADYLENVKALAQCRLYASEIVEQIPTVREVFAYSVLDINDEFYRELKQTKYHDVFSLNERVVYSDFEIGANNEIPMHLYVMPASALVREAKARNRVFEEVLRFDMKK